jgi:hypothetical protein
MSTNTPPSPELFFDTAQAYQRTAALRTAIDLDLFTAIGGGATTVPAIAAKCQASERGIRILCDYLTVVGFMTKSGNAYQLTPDTAFFLTKGSPAYQGGTVEFLTTPEIVHHFDSLAETVRRGSVPKSESTVADENPVWEKVRPLHDVDDDAAGAGDRRHPRRRVRRRDQGARHRPRGTASSASRSRRRIPRPRSSRPTGPPC